MSAIFFRDRQRGSAPKPAGFAPVDNAPRPFATLRRALWTAVDNLRSALPAMVSHAIALAGFCVGYLVTFVLCGGATG